MLLTSSSSSSHLSTTTSPTDDHSPDNAFELDERGEIARPEMLLTDWVELFLLAALLLFGLPLNAIALSKQLNGGASTVLNPRKTSRVSRQEVTRTNFLWLKLHLTIVDLLVIACYCPSHIAWLIGYTWSAGPVLCKAMQYSWDFCFHLMSFGVASIALDRLRTVYGLMRMERTGRLSRPSRQLLFVKRLITWSYLGAALASLPQWFVWTTIDLRDWSQCTTMWHKWRVLEFLEGKESTESFSGERLYTLVHLLTVFWLPFLAILAAYVYIVLFLFFYSLRPPCSSSPIRHSVAATSPNPSGMLVVTQQQQHQSNDLNNNNSGCNTTDPTSSVINCSNSNNKRKLGVLAPLKRVPSERLTIWPSPVMVPPSPSLPTNNSYSSCAATSLGSPLLHQQNGTVAGGGRAMSTSKEYLHHLHNNSNHHSKVSATNTTTTSNVPAWRLEMRSRIFRTTVHVIAAYLICWLPYNVLALATFFSKELQITISVHLELLRICVLLNALLNPFIYGFRRGQP